VFAVAALTLLLNGWLIGRLAWQHAPGSAPATAAPGLSVVSLNVLRANSRKQDVLEYLQAADADIIFLMEVDGPWLAALQSLESTHPHHITSPRADNFGLALFSRVPLRDTRLEYLAGSGAPTVMASVELEGRRLTVMGTHPMPPVGRRAAQLRDVQLAALNSVVRHSPDPVLLVGDFNATPWSRAMRVLASGGLGFRGNAAPWKPTWRVRSLLAIPIDHALCTEPLAVATHEIGPDVGSDHRPVSLRVGWAT
jgi:endonuclease/exonuclease/phosphatase (EEP) superfamily protein YafD